MLTSQICELSHPPHTCCKISQHKISFCKYFMSEEEIYFDE